MAPALQELTRSASDTSRDVSAAGSKAQKLSRLEAVRGLAAAYVFLAHSVPDFLLPRAHPLCQVLRFGQEAVMVFFILSGFVIEHSFAQNPRQGFGYYFLRRFTRIYPIFLLALGLAFLLPSGGPETTSGRVLLGNLLMLQDLDWAKPGVWFQPFGGNLPLWSLSYEWWFYMGFFLVRTRIAPRYQTAVVSAVACVGAIGLLGAPAQIFYFATYFIAWWLGVELARLKALDWKPGRQFALNVAVLLALSAVFLTVTPLGLSSEVWKRYPGLVARHLAIAVTITAAALLWRRAGWRGFDLLVGPFGRIAGISYGLYVLHAPIVTQWRPFAAVVPAWCSVMMAIVGALALAWLAEGPYQAGARRLIQACTGRWGTSARG
jgi:peptidoglycan/LPS O-acetylase OafA/YrhL